MYICNIMLTLYNEYRSMPSSSIHQIRYIGLDILPLAVPVHICIIGCYFSTIILDQHYLKLHIDQKRYLISRLINLPVRICLPVHVFDSKFEH